MYTGSDVQIQRDVMAELAWEPQVVSTDINVEVKNGVVTLSGRVATDVEKAHASRAARRVSLVSAHAAWGTPGVVEIVDQLTLP